MLPTFTGYLMFTEGWSITLLLVFLKKKKTLFLVSGSLNDEAWGFCLIRPNTCLFTQEKGVQDDKFTFTIYLCYLVYAPLYLAGPIVSFNAFASQVYPYLNASDSILTYLALTFAVMVLVHFIFFIFKLHSEIF